MNQIIQIVYRIVIFIGQSNHCGNVCAMSARGEKINWLIQYRIEIGGTRTRVRAVNRMCPMCHELTVPAVSAVLALTRRSMAATARIICRSANAGDERRLFCWPNIATPKAIWQKLIICRCTITFDAHGINTVESFIHFRFWNSQNMYAR